LLNPSFSDCNSFSLKEKIILYDLTNTYFEGSKRHSQIAKRGNSKERRTDCPLITLALTIDEEGFPKSSKTYKGNIGEGSTLETVLEQIAITGGVEKKNIKLENSMILNLKKMEIM